ncbi:MAG TPA: hypothetical protein VH583_12785 [Vicinamibacterales bacterium]
MNPLLPWERLLWDSRPLRFRARLSGERYFLTDFRLVRDAACCPDEIALDDVGEISRTESRLDRALGTSTVIVHPKDDRRPPFVVADIRKGAQLAAALELIATDRHAAHEGDALRAALAWEPHAPAAYREALGAFGAVVLSMTAVAAGLHSHTQAVAFGPDDPIRPNGVQRPTAEIVRYMQTDVMPWARVVLGRIVGNGNVTCETCHGELAEARRWAMPAVAALPEPLVRDRGFEIYSAGMDSQMRNAIYGYSAEPDKSAKAAYMREVVLPGMAALLHRPAYDFTQSYEHNRSENALGCYHCHQVR